MTITANCKINLTMEVLGKRADGYHNIRSVMQFLDMGDTLEIEPADSFSFWCDDSELLGEGNLAVRAYRLMEHHYSIVPLAIRLYKKTPCMSGMGGGSADAAAVLHVVNRTSGLGLSVQRLCELGSTIGADIPACVTGGLLLAEGIGERITTLTQAAPMWFCIIMPSVSFSTPDMYSRMDSAGSFAPEREQGELLSAVQAGNARTTANWLVNSFERVAEPYEVISSAKALLMEQGALAAAMTGAGSAVFGVYPDRQSAEHAREQIAKMGEQVYLCRSAI